MSYEEFWKPLTAIYDASEARAIARLVFEERFNLTLTDILCGKVTQLSAKDQEELRKISQRLLTGEPVQYVLGQTVFCGRSFSVRPGVLIPRPETEELCRLIVRETEADASLDILDIGTGSGCIACTLAAECPQAAVTAWDISTEALDIARENAKCTHVHVSFEQADALAPPPASCRWDIIVSNPPYICEHECHAMAANVLEHEPQLALFVPDDDPLRFYRAIGRYALTALKPGGLLFFEINERFGSEMRTLLNGLGFSQTTLYKDTFGKDRFIRACK